MSSFLDSCGYGARCEFEGHPPFVHCTVQEVNFPPVPDQFSILSGEAIYHLRTSLDHLVCQLIRINKKKPTRDRCWPILGPRHKSLFNRQVKGISETALKRIESHQPYRLGCRYKEHLLWRLKQLNDWDKHSFVIRTSLAKIGGFEVEWVDNEGRLQSCSIVGAEKIEPGRVITFGPVFGIRPEMDVKVKTKPYIVFDGIARAQFEPVIPVLVKLSSKVRNVIESFKNEFP